MDERRLSHLIAAAIVFILLLVFLDVTRRTMSRSDSASSALSLPDSVHAQVRGGPAGLPAGDSGSAVAGVRLVQPSLFDQGPSHMELVARAETRRQIRASAGMTYLSDIVGASSDSMLHRWDNRVTRPVRVYLNRGRAANFQPAFLDVIRAAFREWEEAVPVKFDASGDSASAEVQVFWKVQFDMDRTGQTDLSWDGEGHIQAGVVTLATFDPEGQPMGVEEVRIVALHEIGHLIGLDHSTDSGDVMFPVASARGLSRRDVETARLLYRLAPGSLR
jgi:hypothetical protein